MGNHTRTDRVKQEFSKNVDCLCFSIFLCSRTVGIYSIGEISKMVKISLDTLRYYNEIQLFNPDYINPSNNYRFYSEEQVKELLHIMDLKECGFNLDEIKIIIKLNDKTKMKQIFEKKETELLNQRKKISLSLEKIKAIFEVIEIEKN